MISCSAWPLDVASGYTRSLEISSGVRIQSGQRFQYSFRSGAGDENRYRLLRVTGGEGGLIMVGESWWGTGDERTGGKVVEL